MNLKSLVKKSKDLKSGDKILGCSWKDEIETVERVDQAVNPECVNIQTDKRTYTGEYKNKEWIVSEGNIKNGNHNKTYNYTYLE